MRFTIIITIMSTIIITGASSGIGKTCAEAFIAKGWTVGLVARRAEALEDMARGHQMLCPCPAM